MRLWLKPSWMVGIVLVLITLSFRNHLLEQLSIYLDHTSEVMNSPFEGSFDLSNSSNPITQEIFSSIQRNSLPIIMATTSSLVFDMTLNWYTSVKRANVQNKILFVCHDSSVVELLRPLIEHNDMLALYPLPFSAAPDASYGSYDYALIAQARPQLVYAFVSRQIPLWFSDVDMVWNKNPWPFISDLQGKGHDIVVLKDGPKICAGFFAVGGTTSNGTIALFREWKEGIKGKRLNQDLFNVIVKQHDEVSFGYLPEMLFPDGNQYFQKFNITQKQEVVVVHNNYIIGAQVKVARFKEHNLWLI